VSQYSRLTPETQAKKRQIAAVLHADDHRATIGAVADYLGVSCRGLLSAKHDPRNAENSHFVSASTLQPPGYTPAELVKFNFNSGSKVWRPGPAFKQHMGARLQQMFPAPGVSASGSVSGIDGSTPSIPGIVHASVPQPPSAASIPTGAPAGCSERPGAPANPDLTALLQHAAYLYRGSNYPMSGVLSLAAAGPLYRSGVLIIDLYAHAYNHPGDDPKLAKWISTRIPPADRSEFVGCWKLATKQVKVAQARWENAGHRGELPPVPEVEMGRRKRNEGTITDPGVTAIGVALDRAEELRAIAVGARARLQPVISHNAGSAIQSAISDIGMSVPGAAALELKLKSEFMVSLFEFNLALVELMVAWEAKWYRARKT
jgi:hypothetical protein